MAVLRRKGFTLIEVLVVVAIIAVLISVGIWAYRTQILKGRDAQRKADLAEWQKLLEDYLNDNVCYPEGPLACGPTIATPFEGYLTEIPCDPINSVQYNYMYTFEEGGGCDKWYKLYTKLENEQDPIIAQVGCEGGCGPSNNYNYWVGSPNVTRVAQLPGEFWPDIPGVPSPSPEPSPGASPEPSPGASPEPSPEPSPGVSPSPSPEPSPGASPEPSPEPSSGMDPSCESQYGPKCLFSGCGPGECCGSCCKDDNRYRCDEGDPGDPYDDRCVLDPLCP